MLADPKQEVQVYQVMEFTVGHMKRVLVLSGLCGVDAHFLGRSLICGGAACPACKAGLASKYTGYVAVLFQSTRRLLRLTSRSAVLGSELGLWKPGEVVDVERFKHRQPLRVVGVGAYGGFDRCSNVSPSELLSVVARLHGLAALQVGLPLQRAEEDVVKGANALCALVLKGRAA